MVGFHVEEPKGDFTAAALAGQRRKGREVRTSCLTWRGRVWQSRKAQEQDSRTSFYEIGDKSIYPFCFSLPVLAEQDELMEDLLS